MDYYLGHTDSCQVESGGPLWQYIGKIMFITIWYLKNQKSLLFYNSSYLLNTWLHFHNSYDTKDKRATIVGVVSRGGDCAANNSPGIYTNVQKHLKWIKETISDYACWTFWTYCWTIIVEKQH